jgi:hypothetical protein
MRKEARRRSSCAAIGVPATEDQRAGRTLLSDPAGVVEYPVRGASTSLERANFLDRGRNPWALVVLVTRGRPLSKASPAAVGACCPLPIAVSDVRVVAETCERARQDSNLRVFMRVCGRVLDDPSPARAELPRVLLPDREGRMRDELV